MSKFQFDMRQKVRLIESDEQGTVVGRAEYTHDENGYLIRYKSGDGRMVQNWWGESALLEGPSDQT